MRQRDISTRWHLCGRTSAMRVVMASMQRIERIVPSLVPRRSSYNADETSPSAKKDRSDGQAHPDQSSALTHRFSSSRRNGGLTHRRWSCWGRVSTLFFQNSGRLAPGRQSGSFLLGGGFSRDARGQRRDSASSDRVVAVALLSSVGNMVRWALRYKGFLRFAFFCRRRDPRLKRAKKGKKIAFGAA